MNNKGLLISLALVLIIIFITSCGPSKKEIAEREAFVKDSTEKVEAERLRVHNEKIEVGKSIKRDHLNEVIRELNDNLERANKKLASLSTWRFGRSYDQKQTQLSNQRTTIFEIEQMIENVKKQISLTHLFEFYNFQETPEGTVNHIFESAKSRDYSKMGHLIDPYGEFDNSALEVCYVGMLSDSYQKQWLERFEKGRIIGEPISGENKGEVKLEIATGWNSDKIVGIVLVNRFGNWFIKEYGSYLDFDSREDAMTGAEELLKEAEEAAMEEVGY